MKAGTRYGEDTVSALGWIIVAAAVVIAYYTVRRWIVALIFASVVAGALASPRLAEWQKELLARRDRLDPQSKEYEQVNDSIAEIDPMCGSGRRDLLQAAWEIYRQCRWTGPPPRKE